MKFYYGWAVGTSCDKGVEKLVQRSDGFQLSPSAGAATLPSVTITGTSIADTCPKDPVCPATKYRSADGTCNNLENKDWGKSFGPFKRLTPAQYADGIQQPRVATDGTALPSARLVSSTIIKGDLREFPDIASSFMAFGQFIDHDMSLTPTTRGANGTGILCCPPRITPELKHPECMEIDIPEADPFYAQFQQRCMEFVRTIVAPPKPECTLGVREQINQLTSYIDASQIYGSRDDQMENLRSKTGGKLKVGGGSNGREFPPNQNAGGCTSNVGQGQFCFQAGDVRSTEQPQLATYHVIFLREHNRIADELGKLNPGWNDEVIFQETRRVIGAMMQYIVYNEYLPILLGNRVMRKFNIQMKKDGFSDKYNPATDGTILNEFATAAYRYGHSLVPGIVQLTGEGGTNQPEQQLKDHFLTSYDTNLVDNYVRGMTTQASQVVDDFVTPALTNHLFERGNRGFGLDLAALNIQRGRDHAIGSYTKTREVCNLPKVASFQDLSKYMDSNIADQFSKLYKSVDDVDLWVAGVSEKPLPGAVVGPTFACIIAEQFRRAAVGDRLWFERGNTESSFSEAQLIQIRQSTLARLICDNTDVKEMQPLALFKPSSWNPQVPCNSAMIPKMNLRAWRNEPVWGTR